MTPQALRRLPLPGRLASILRCLAVLLPIAALHAAPVAFSIPSQPAPAALQAFIKQSGVDVFFVAKDLDGIQANPLSGSWEVEAGLRELLRGSGFSPKPNGQGRFMIVRDGGTPAKTGSVEGSLFSPAGSGRTTAGVTVAVSETGESTTVGARGQFVFPALRPGTYTLVAYGEGFSRLRIEDVVVSAGHAVTLGAQQMPIIRKGGEVQMMAEVVVHANREEVEVMEKYLVTEGNERPQPFANTGNIDLPRTINDVQPYYMWDGARIENSGASTIQDFFQTMVPMDVNRQSTTQSSLVYSWSNINLGGFAGAVGGGGSNGTTVGSQQTLILVNGLPQPQITELGNPYQPDLNGIPLSAIDHIEVLPSSASAIYGASAAGGVVNIVLKHDYTGAELKMTYGNAFDTNVPLRRVSLTVGASLEGGKTNILLTASYQSQGALLLQSRRSQIVDPYQARYFSLYPGGELALLGITSSTGVFSTSSASTSLPQPVVTSASGAPLFSGSSAIVVQVPAGYAGGSGLAPLQANIGRFNLSHPNNSLNSTLGGLREPIVQGPTQKSFDLRVRRQMTGWLEAYAEVGSSSDSQTQFIDRTSFSGITVPATAPGNPFGQTVKVSGNDTSDYPPTVADTTTKTASMGLKASLPHAWRSDLNFTWGESDFVTYDDLVLNTTALQAAVNSGTVNLIADLSRYPANLVAFPEYLNLAEPHSTVDALQLKLAGPLVKLWAGTPSLALGFEHQKMGNGGGFEYLLEPGNANLPGIAGSSVVDETVYFPGASSSDNSAYGELSLPLAAKDNGLFGIRQLDLQAAARIDSLQEFSPSPSSVAIIRETNGTIATSPNFTGTTTLEPIKVASTTYHSTNGTIGFRYKPVEDVMFRWSFTTAFTPPYWTQLRPPISAGTQTQSSGAYPGVPTTSPWSYVSITDPLLNASYTVPTITGGHPGLQPETSHGIEWGIILQPKFVPGLRLSLDYSKTTQYNEIVVPAVATLIAEASQFPGRVTRGTPNPGQTVGPIVQIDDTYLNAPQTTTSSYNLEVDYTLRTASAGTFTLSGIANSWQHFKVQSVLGGPFVEQLSNSFVTGSGLADGTGSGLARFKGNFGVEWMKGPVSAGWLVTYVGPYTNGAKYGVGGSIPTQGTMGGWVSGQAYHNAHLGYRFGKGAAGNAWWARALENTAVDVGVKNVFNHVPPYDALSSGFYYSYYGNAELANYYLSVKKSF